MLRDEADAAGELVLLLERGGRAYLRLTLATAERGMLRLRCCRRCEGAVVGRCCLQMREAEGRLR
jgi:hypothetical protein